MKVIVDGMKNLERATTFAAKCDDSAVWSQVIMKRSRLPYTGIMYGNLPAPCHNMARGARSQLARAQLDAGMVGEAIDTYAKANDVTAFAEVINAAQRENAYEALVTYLSMARKVAKNDTIDTELVYAYCKTVRARPRALSVSLSQSFLYGAFMWARRALNSQKWRFPARAEQADRPRAVYRKGRP
jgi:hypothetical protein